LEGHTFNDFKELATKNKTHQTFDQIEKEYWDIVENGKGGTVKVEYAADLSVDKVGSGFGKHGQKIIHPKQKEYVDHPWNLNNLQN
jgi:hypothetical protein